MRHHDHSLAQGEIILLLIDITHETLVDFEIVNIKMFEVGQGGIPGTEIVDRKLNVSVAKLEQAIGDAVVGLHQQVLGYFHTQSCPVDALFDEVSKPLIHAAGFFDPL